MHNEQLNIPVLCDGTNIEHSSILFKLLQQMLQTDLVFFYETFVDYLICISFLCLGKLDI